MVDRNEIKQESSSAPKLLSTSQIPTISTNGKIDISKPWRIAHVLEGHTSDVRALGIRDDGNLGDIDYEMFESASRDETVRTWFRKIPDHSNARSGPPSGWFNGVRLHGNRYQNAVVHLRLGDEGVTIMGGLDGRILLYKFNYFQRDEHNKMPDLTEPNQIVHDHYDNVCHLSLSAADRTPKNADRVLISASWDGTSRTWLLCQDDKSGKKLKPLHHLKGHQRSVLDAQIVSAEPEKEEYLTCSADFSIRYWLGEETKMVFNGHTDVVRSIAILPNPKGFDVKEPDVKELFATCSNDGTIKLWSLNDQNHTKEGTDNSLSTLIPKEKDGTPILDLMFSVRSAGADVENGHRLLVSGGEGGRVYIWNVETQEEVMQILQPVTTCWDVIFLPLSGDIATADSDSKIRVYTQRRNNTEFLATENQIEQQSKGILVELSAQEVEEHNKECEKIAR